MKWNELIKGIEIQDKGGEGNPEITGITYDSRLVRDGYAFVAIPGIETDGSAFVKDAIKRGARAVITQGRVDTGGRPWIKVGCARKMSGILAAKLYDVSLDRLKLVGITGTNGKTTTSYLFQALFEEYYGRGSSWLLGTIEYNTGSERSEASRTTPESADVFRQLYEAPEYPGAVTMEVSSHALCLSRIEGMKYDAGVWLNLSQDHLDFHKDMNEYYEAKKLLFTDYMKDGGVAVINADDIWGKKLSGEIKDLNVVTFGESEQADLRIVNRESGWNRTSVSVEYRGEKFEFVSALTGSYNSYNIAAFAACAFSLGYSSGSIQKALFAVKSVPGRMQTVSSEYGFIVVVDYAHTPDALKKLLSTVEELTTGRIVTVFGCGGDRDKGKRPLMAEAVSEYSDEVVVTSDNPRCEDARKIIEDIVTGIPVDRSYRIIENREKAIFSAVESAEAGDCVVIAGKGHETYQEISKKRYPFDDREVALKAIEQIWERKLSEQV